MTEVTINEKEQTTQTVEDGQHQNDNAHNNSQDANTSETATDNSIDDIDTSINESQTIEQTSEGIETAIEDQLKELNEKYIRLHAEFDNYRRRTNKEKLDIISHANEKLLIDLLPTIDDFERAMESNKNSDNLESVKEGFVLIYNKFISTLEAKGLKQMEAKNTDFNSDLHDAIANVPTTDDKKGKVVDDVEKGYLLNDKVIRFAKVVVGN